MLKEAIEYVAGMAVAAMKPTFETDAALPGKVIVKKTDGTIEFVDLPALPRKSAFSDLQSFAEAALDKRISPDPEIFLGRIVEGDGAMQIHALLFHDRKNRRVASAMRITPTDRAKSMAKLRTMQFFNPDQVVEFLRFEAGGCVPSTLLAVLRKLDFKRIQSQSSNVQHGSGSYGNSVEAEAQGTSQIPESFFFHAPAFATSGFRHITVNAEVGIHIDAQNGRIGMRLLPDQLADAQDAAATSAMVAVVEEVDRESAIPVYAGSGT